MLETFDILEEAKSLSEENPLVHWSAGLIYAQVPGFFGKSDEAMTELLWLVDRPELEPTPGFYREVYHFLAKLYAANGEETLAEEYLHKSGYWDYEPKALFMGWFATTKEKGLRFAPTPWDEEIVPGRVLAVRGFGFSDIHFVVSDNGQELISIDAGTQPYSMEGAYDFIMQRYPDLPPLTTVFITHAHWDHIGGFTYLKTLRPEVTFYGRDNYAGTVSRSLRNHTYEQFRGDGFQALDTMDQALRRNPRHILHGHVGITVLYGTTRQLQAFRNAYEWLVGETRRHLRNGYSVNDIVRLNLIMPGLQDHPEAFFGYLAPRDHIIARVGDHMSGIWREDVTGMEPGGLDALTSVEYGRFLELYLGLAAGQVEDALRRMIDGGDNELALQFAVAAERRYEDNLGIIQLKQEAGDNLRSAAQFFDPFKFVVYTEMIGKEHGSIPRAPVR